MAKTLFAQEEKSIWTRKKNWLQNFIETKLVPLSTGFAQNSYIRCIGSGSQSLMAVIMLGAIFNLFNSIVWEPYKNFITSTGISDFLTVVYNASMNFMGGWWIFLWYYSLQWWYRWSYDWKIYFWNKIKRLY